MSKGVTSLSLSLSLSAGLWAREFPPLPARRRRPRLVLGRISKKAHCTTKASGIRPRRLKCSKAGREVIADAMREWCIESACSAEGTGSRTRNRKVRTSYKRFKGCPLRAAKGTEHVALNLVPRAQAVCSKGMAPAARLMVHGIIYSGGLLPKFAKKSMERKVSMEAKYWQLRLARHCAFMEACTTNGAVKGNLPKNCYTSVWPSQFNRRHSSR